MEEIKKDKMDEKESNVNANRILLAFISVLIVTPSFLALGEKFELPGNPQMVISVVFGVVFLIDRMYLKYAKSKNT